MVIFFIFQVIDGNPNFDQKLHENFLPHDPIQQYVNAYGGPYLPPSSAFGYPNMQWGPYGPQSHIPIAYAPVQTEYEGILLPVPGPPPPPPSPHSLSIHETGPLTPPFFSEMIYFVKDLMPRSLIYMIARWSAFLISLFGLVAFGGVITTAICTFTPLCTISFAALPFAAALRTTIASKVDDNASTIERVRRATEFFNSAIQKYEHLQRTVDMRTKSP